MIQYPPGGHFDHTYRETALAAVGKGWWPLIDMLYDRVDQLQADGKDITLGQVKQKFGALRVYPHGADADLIRPLIMQLERVSVETCESCGAPGTIQTLPVGSAGMGRGQAICASCWIRDAPLESQRFQERVKRLFAELERRDD